jgi:bifunctional UDP-N-acetylglucosamine pyrophosphorylase / glucosamine-1-phosphate N-acetyltransferase
VAVVVLAAGEGKRLRSNLPKVLHPAAGRPLLVHALEATRALDAGRTVVVASLRRDEIEAAVASHNLSPEYVVQDPPRGTGDAARVAMDTLAPDVATVVVTNGDLPLLRGETFVRLIEEHKSSGAAATLLTTQADTSSDFGRVLRHETGDVSRIVEVRDASPEELETTEVNVGVYAFDAALLREALANVAPDNSQGEYYLTDVVGLLGAGGHRLRAIDVDVEETLGVNDRVQLAEVGAALYRRTARELMQAGVTIVDPASTFIEPGVQVAPDALILPFTFLEGTTTIEASAQVGPQTRIIDSVIREGATVTFAVVRGSDVGPEASVGPYASLRPGTKLARGSKLGTFVETKNTTLGADSKAPHLSYLGDATIGERVNVGAGTITCNWDGVSKHPTTIEDDAYISSDTMLVAPVRIGKGAATGAGSVVREDVPDGALAVGVPARNIEGRGQRTKKS